MALISVPKERLHGLSGQPHRGERLIVSILYKQIFTVNFCFDVWGILKEGSLCPNREFISFYYNGLALFIYGQLTLEAFALFFPYKIAK